MHQDHQGPPDQSPERTQQVRRRLAAWYEVSGRELPWRRCRDPYQILVSEMMLVQTTVTAVVPHFTRFLIRFPDVQSLASASEADVLKAWEGLGYYRRARQLHAAARRIVECHQGKMPETMQAIRALPGVGRYMAGAILSFAFDLPEPIVEANSQRVLARLLAWEGELKASATQARLWEAAGRLVPRRQGGRFNHALMDLGALICTPRSPICLLCPLASVCESRRLGLQDRIPVASPKPPPLAVTESCVLVVRNGELLVVQRGAEGLWAEFWEFPTVHLAGANPAGRSPGAPETLPEGVKRLTGMDVVMGPRLRTLTYSVTRHRILLHVHVARAVGGRLKAGPGLANVRWSTLAGLADLTLGSATRRVASWIVEDPGRLEWNQA